MTTTLPSLDALVPLSPLPWTSRVAGASNGVRVYDGKGSPLPGCFSCGENDAVYEPEDGALIAAAPDLLAAVREVLAEVERFRFTGLGIPSGFDEGTDTAAYAIFCALAAHLDLTDPEGDPT